VSIKQRTPDRLSFGNHPSINKVYLLARSSHLSEECPLIALGRNNGDQESAIGPRYFDDWQVEAVLLLILLDAKASSFQGGSKLG